MASSFMPMTIEFRHEPSFLPTRAHARFVEFAEACTQARYIGICHGRPGVGKTRSAREYAAWPGLLDYSVREKPTEAQADAIRRCKALFSTATVANTPKSIQAVLGISLVRWGHARLVLEGRLSERDCLHLSDQACPLVIMDEADRLSLKSLEHLRDLYDRHGFGLILIGMPGLEKRLARYPQLYSRIGFVHEFKALGAEETRFLVSRHGTGFGIRFDQDRLEHIEALAAVIRITAGNLRLIERLLGQMRRIMTVNGTEEVSEDIVHAARDCLVIGPGG